MRSLLNTTFQEIYTQKSVIVRDAQIFVYYSCVTLREGGGGLDLASQRR